jgi:hypothetical protein
VCPALCGNKHWLSLRESQQKHFRVVCDCGEVFKPKTIEDITINFTSKTEPHIVNAPTQETLITDDLPLPDETVNFQIFMEECVEMLCGFGFDKKEAKELLEKSYSHKPTKDSTQLVKQTLLDNFGVTSHD